MNEVEENNLLQIFDYVYIGFYKFKFNLLPYICLD